MMGRQTGNQSQLFYLFNLERRIPADHLLRRINPVVTRILVEVREQLAPFYSELPSCVERKSASDHSRRRPKGHLRQLWESAPAPPAGLRPASFVMSDTPVEGSIYLSGCLNYPCRTPLFDSA